MTNYKLVQDVQKRVNDYNQDHNELLYVDWYNGSYYIGHPDIPEFKYDIGYFKNPRNQGVSRFQSGEELVNSVGK